MIFQETFDILLKYCLEFNQYIFQTNTKLLLKLTSNTAKICANKLIPKLKYSETDKYFMEWTVHSHDESKFCMKAQKIHFILFHIKQSLDALVVWLSFICRS